MSSSAEGAVRQKLDALLQATYPDVSTDSDGDFTLRRGETITWVSVKDTAEGAPLIIVNSVLSSGMPVSDELTRYLATEANNLMWGQFELSLDPMPMVRVSHTILGSTLDEDKARVVIDAVTEASERYGAVVNERFGGTSMTAAAEAFERAWLEEVGADQTPQLVIESPRRSTLRTLALLGLVIGAVVGFFVYRWSESIALAIYAGLAVLVTVWFPVSELTSGPVRFARFVRQMLLPVTSVAVLFGVQALWDLWWVSVLVAATVGVVLGFVVQRIVFPGLSRRISHAKRVPPGDGSGEGGE